MIHPKIKIMSLFAHPPVVPNRYAFLEVILKGVAVIFFIHTIKMNDVQHELNQLNYS